MQTPLLRPPTRPRRLRTVLAVMMLLAVSIPPLGTAVGSQAAPGGAVLRVRQQWWPGTMDPQVTAFTEEIAVSSLDYEGLTRLDTNLQTVPAAAEAWTFSADGTLLTFHLREGLVYSDGSPLTAENFRFAIERACDPQLAAYYASILFDIVGCEAFFTSLAPQAGTPAATPGIPADREAAYAAARAALGVRAVDDRTLEIALTQPAPYFPTIASTWVFYPVKAESIAAGGVGWAQDPALRIGNGPFRMTDLVADQTIAFGANERYWAGRPALDGIDFVYIPDPAVALEAYRAGDVHITQLGPDEVPIAQADPTLAPALVSFPLAVTTNLMFNLRQEPFTDQKVREAFAYGFDRETYCTQIRASLCVPTYSWIPPGIPGAIATEAFAFDPAAARQALADSTYGGAENLPPIAFSYLSDDPSERARSEWLAGHYRDVLGVEVSLVPVEGATLSAMTATAETFPQMLLLGWVEDYPDPQNWLSIYWTCGATLFAGQAGYCNEAFDALIRQADQELDPARRLALYEEAGALLVEDAPAVFAFNQATVMLVDPAVTGYIITPTDIFFPGQWASLLTLDLVGPGAAATPPR